MGEVRHRWRIRPTVVVQHDDDAALGVTEVVQRLVCHPPGERTVADDCHHVATIRVLSVVTSDRHAMCVRQDRGCMTVFDEVVHAFLATRVTREPTCLSQLGEAATTPRDQFVDVRLVSGVPEDGIARRLEHAMQGKGELHRAEVRPQVTTGLGDCCHDEVANLAREFLELRVVEAAQIARLANIGKRHGNLER